MIAVVDGLPKSWVTAPSITDRDRRDRGRRFAGAPGRSPSACEPTRRLPGAIRVPARSRPALSFPGTADRRRRARAPARNPIDGLRARSRSFSISPQMRSGGRSSSRIARQSAAVVIVERQLKPRRELHGAQHAQAVVAEGLRIDRSQNRSARDRRARRNGSRYSLGKRIPRDRVDGEVAPARRLLDRHRGVAFDDEAFVAAARPSIRGVEGRCRWCRSCRRGSSGRSAPLCRTAPGAPGDRRRECQRPPCRDPCLRRRLSDRRTRARREQAVAHPSADDERATTALADRARIFRKRSTMGVGSVLRCHFVNNNVTVGAVDIASILD